MADHTAKIFPKYSFSDQAAQDFFSHNNEKYDIIFMSHVFEHMDIDIGIELSKMIYSHLQEDGIWINLMPNGASLG
jgi:predicted SAM-dependent methyltransferase